MTGGLVPALDRLCPMHLQMDEHGIIRHAGPSLCKLRPGAGLVGQPFLDVIGLRRAAAPVDLPSLLARAGEPLHLRFRAPPRTDFKGVLVTGLPGMAALVNLSFGIGIREAVQDYDLTVADFAATDLAVEMLYLIEANAAAMAASRNLKTRLQGAMIAAEERAFTDTLTGLRNRRAMDRVLDRMIGDGRHFALMHVDLDYFKAVNDTHGHAAGDHVLQEVARAMVAVTRAEDTVARVGGDEFVILFDRLDDRTRLDDVARRLIGRLEQPILWQGRKLQISASAGTALSRAYAVPDAERLLADADTALYAAKRAGRAQHMFFDPAMARMGQGAEPLPDASRA